MSYIPHFIHTHTAAIKAPSTGFHLASTLQSSDVAQEWHPCCTFKHLQGLILKPLYAGTASFKRLNFPKQESPGINLQKCAVLSRGTNRHRGLPSTPRMGCELSPRAGSHPTLTMNKSTAEHIPAAQCTPLTGILLSSFFAHLHLTSVWFATVLSKPPLLKWVYKH